MKYKLLSALLIAGLLLLSSCDKTPSEVSEGDASQSEAVDSDINSEYTSSVEEKSTPESSEIEESSEEPSEESSEQSAEESSEEPSEESSEHTSEEPSEPSWPIGTRAYELYGTEYMCVKYENSGRKALADKDGNMLTKFEYEGIYVTACKANYIVLCKGNHRKEVDLQLNTIIEGDYNDIRGVTKREYFVIKPYGSELSSLYLSDGKTKCDLPEFKSIYFYPLGSADVLCIKSVDDINSWYLIDEENPLVFTPYDMDTTVDRDYDKLMKLFNSFVAELKNDSRDGMKKYATADLINSYDAFLKNPDAEGNYVGKVALKIKTFGTGKLYEVYPNGFDYDGLVYVINEKEGKYVCSFCITEYFKDFNEYATFHSYFTTVSDGKGGLLIDSLACREMNEVY